MFQPQIWNEVNVFFLYSSYVMLSVLCEFVSVKQLAAYFNLINHKSIKYYDRNRHFKRTETMIKDLFLIDLLEMRARCWLNFGIKQSMIWEVVDIKRQKIHFTDLYLKYNSDFQFLSGINVR